MFIKHNKTIQVQRDLNDKSIKALKIPRIFRTIQIFNNLRMIEESTYIFPYENSSYLDIPWHFRTLDSLSSRIVEE